MRIGVVLAVLMVLAVAAQSLREAERRLLQRPVFLQSQHRQSANQATLFEMQDFAVLHFRSAGRSNSVLAYLRRTPPLPIPRPLSPSMLTLGLHALDGDSLQRILPEVRSSDFTLCWSADGVAVALWHRGEPIALLTANAGYSRAVAQPTEVALPWNEQVHRLHFADPESGTGCEPS